MPYLNCPSCRMSLYSATAYSTVEECPRCMGVFERRIPMFGTERRYEAPFGFREPEAPFSRAVEPVS